MFYNLGARLCGAVGSVSDSRVRVPGFDLVQPYTLFLLPLIQEGQLSVTGESMCTKNTG